VHSKKEFENISIKFDYKKKKLGLNGRNERDGNVAYG